MIAQKEFIVIDKTPASCSGYTDTDQDPLTVSNYHQSKIVAERLLGGGLLFVAAPLIGIILAIVRATSSGKGIYKQIRVGKDGKEFMIYKIRTMCHNAESHGHAEWSIPGDSRITRVGKILRRMHLDELPQLANVARGQMSLIGPRPERPEIVAILEQRVPGYLDRLAILPGVTGLAQINLPADASLESVRKKVILDRKYIESATMALDLRIFFCTLFRMTGLSNGVAPWIFGVECDPETCNGSAKEFCDTSALALPLDDTQVNIPSSLIAEPFVVSTAVLDAPFEHEKAPYSSEAASGNSPSELDYQKASSSPRRPR